MTLDAVPVGATAVVAGLARNPTNSPDRQLRWAELGLRPGAHVQVRSRTAGGGRILGIGLSRIAVDRSVLRAVTVRITDGADRP